MCIAGTEFENLEALFKRSPNFHGILVLPTLSTEPPYADWSDEQRAAYQAWLQEPGATRKPLVPFLAEQGITQRE